MVQIPTINTATATVLKSLFMVLDFLFRDNCRSEVTPKKRNIPKSGRAAPLQDWWVEVSVAPPLPCLQVCGRLPGGSAEELRLDEPGGARRPRRPRLFRPTSPETKAKRPSQGGSAGAQLLVPQPCCGEKLGQGDPAAAQAALMYTMSQSYWQDDITLLSCWLILWVLFYRCDTYLEILLKKNPTPSEHVLFPCPSGFFRPEWLCENHCVDLRDSVTHGLLLL